MRRELQIRAQFLRFVDAGLFAISFWLAHFLRAHAGDFGALPVQILTRLGSETQILPFDTYFPLFIVTMPLAVFFLQSNGFYSRAVMPSRRSAMVDLFKVSFLVTVGLIFTMFMLKLPSARGLIVVFGGVSFFVMIAREELFRAWLRARSNYGAFKKQVLLVGGPENTQRLREELETGSPHDVHVLDEVNIFETSVDQLIALLHRKSPNGVVLAANHKAFPHIEQVIQACELEGVEVWLLADFFKTTISQTSVDELHGRPMLVFHSGMQPSWQSVLKRVIDFTAALTALVLLAPFFALIALLIKTGSKGPVFYRDKRCGLNGRPFSMYKFRSMVTNAEELKLEIAEMNEMSWPVFKVSNDPRVTPFGAFMRKFSIDEFPQFFNVLKGDMSLVGPRPLVIDEVKQFYDFAHRRRLSVRPGLTCLWQINGRSNLREFNDWMRMDLDYIDGWSLWLDFKILARTIPTVLSGTGAK